MLKNEKITIKPADKILNLPKYVFAELDEWKAEARKRGMSLIDLGIGNPDGATHPKIVAAAIESIKKKESHGYPSFKGKAELRTAVSHWMKRRYNVDIDPETEVQTLNGAKEGLANIAMAFTNPGDVNIVPDPYYPVLSRGTIIASGTPFHIPLREENNFLPDLDEIPEDIARKAKLIFLNFPNNPTGACATKEFWEKAVAFCKKYSILLVSDLAYGEVTFDGYRPLSVFSVEGAKDIAVEFHSCSKTFNMAGWRLGFVVGKKEFIDTIFAMKNNMDYGSATIVQDAAIEALNSNEEIWAQTMKNYSERFDYLVKELSNLGWKIKKPKATMYMWLKVPKGHTSKEFCRYVLDTAGVVFTPGIAFGEMSDGYFRLSAVQPIELIKEAMQRLKDYGIRYE